MTPPLTQVEMMRPEHTIQAASLLRDAYSADLHPYIAFCQPGTARFLAIEAGEGRPDRFWVATTPTGEVVAFAAFSMPAPGSLFLSHVVVAEAHRGQGLGTRLIATCVREHPNDCTLSLDVFSENTGAQILYERWGMAWSTQVTHWLVKAAPSPRAGEAFTIPEASVAQERLDRFGFAQVSVKFARHEKTVGLPSRTVLRCANFQDWTDHELQAALRYQFADIREILALQSEHPPTMTHGECRFESRRLIGRLGDLNLEPTPMENE